MSSRRRQEEKRPDFSGQSGDWPDLPSELLEGIMRLVAPIDRVAVRLVCSSWRACARASFPADLPFEAPRLLLRRPGPGGSLGFFSLHRGEMLPFALPNRLSTGRCCGHIAGWLAMAFDDDREIALYNLTSGESVAVPRPPVFPVAKIVLSAPPTSRGWVAAVLGRSGTIALLQPDSSESWMTIQEGAVHGGFQDMAIWRGRLCALGGDGAVTAYRVNLAARVAAAWVVRETQYPVAQGSEVMVQNYVRGRRRTYLVERSGELLVVRRDYSVWRDVVDVAVEVVRFAAEERKWEVVAELPPGQALFVGAVASVAAAATAASGIRESCVYVARGVVEMMVPHAIGVYSLADGETEGLAIAGGHSVADEPVWISPSLAA